MMKLNRKTGELFFFLFVYAIKYFNKHNPSHSCWSKLLKTKIDNKQNFEYLFLDKLFPETYVQKLFKNWSEYKLRVTWC